MKRQKLQPAEDEDTGDVNVCRDIVAVAAPRVLTIVKQLQARDLACTVCQEVIYPPFFRCAMDFHLFCSNCQVQMQYGKNAKNECAVCKTAGPLINDISLAVQLKPHLRACVNAPSGCKRKVYEWDNDHVDFCQYHSHPCPLCARAITGDLMTIWKHFSAKPSCAGLQGVASEISGFARIVLREDLANQVYLVGGKYLLFVKNDDKWYSLALVANPSSRLLQHTCTAKISESCATYEKMIVATASPNINLTQVIPVILGAKTFGISLKFNENGKAHAAHVESVDNDDAANAPRASSGAGSAPTLPSFVSSYHVPFNPREASNDTRLATTSRNVGSHRIYLQTAEEAATRYEEEAATRYAVEADDDEAAADDDDDQDDEDDGIVEVSAF